MIIDVQYLQWIWPLAPAQRNRTKPLRVLALGLPRVGTDSLSKALQKLGYDHVYHGFDTLADVEDCVNRCELMHRKVKGEVLTAADFDPVIGHCEAVTDVPCVSFASELIRAYPDALVIIDRRADVNAWHRSLCAALDESAGKTGPLGILWIIYLSHRKLFWMRRMFERTQNTYLWHNDWTKNAQRTFEDHYELLMREVPENRRLVWTVQDGWGPLCDFLDRPAPAGETFPRGNAQDAYLDYVMKKHVNVYAKEAFVNISVVLAGVIGIFSLLYWRST